MKSGEAWLAIPATQAWINGEAGIVKTEESAMEKLKFKLTDGRHAELMTNDWGEVKPQELVDKAYANDIYHACELLDVAPCTMSYGLVKPKVMHEEEAKLHRAIDVVFKRIQTEERTDEAW